MHLSFQHNYNGTPEQVVDLFRNPDFITDVAVHAGATDPKVQVSDGVTQLEMGLPTPPNLSKFIGKAVNLRLSFSWDQPDASGARPGDVDVDVKGLPVAVNAKGLLRAVENGSVADYTGDVTVRIPLVGGKVEKMAAPFLTGAFDGIERRAREWLARAS